MQSKVTGKFTATNVRLKVCHTRNCSKKSYCRSMCKTCYEQMKKNGRPLTQLDRLLNLRGSNSFALKDGCAEMIASGKKVLVDSKDVPRLCRKTWFVTKNGYAMSKHTYLHHYIHGKLDGFYTDHINRNRLDNRKSNIRVVTPQQNVWNYTSHGSSTARNVSFDRVNNSWSVDVKGVLRKRYKSLEQAKEEAYKARVKKYGAEFA